MKKISLFIIVILSINIFAPHTQAASKGFSDLTKDNPDYESIMKLVDQGLMNGYPDGTFHPKSTMSRKHVAAIINKEFPQFMLNPNLDVNKLADISKNDSAYNAIKNLYESKLMPAFYDKKEKKSYFKPNDPITRVELALIISPAYGYHDDYEDMKHKFADEKEFLALQKEKYKGIGLLYSVRPLHKYKIMNGYADNTFRPSEPVTRGQFASIIVRAQENMSEAHRQMYNLTIHKYKGSKNVPLPKGVTDVKALKKQQEVQFKEYLKTDRITVNTGWTIPGGTNYKFSQYIKLYSERYNLTEKEFVELINRLVETGEVYTGVIDEINEYRMYYDFEEGRLYKKAPGGV